VFEDEDDSVDDAEFDEDILDDNTQSVSIYNL
jgi:hypothetical protein